MISRAGKDVDNVSVGRVARIRILAFKGRSTGELLGEVRSVSADIQEDQRTGMGYFTARVTVSAEEVARLGENRKHQPGLSAEVFITAGSRTALSYLLQPFNDAMRGAWREEWYLNHLSTNS